MRTGYGRACLVLVFLWLGSSARAQLQETYLKGIALAGQGKYTEARRQFEEALRYDDDNPDFLLKLGEACLESGDTQAALNYLQRLDDIHPGQGSYGMARIYASEGKAGEAVRQLKINLRSAYRQPSDILLLDPAFSAIEKSPEWKSLWSVDWYTEDEELLQEIRYLTGSGDYLQALEITDTEIAARPGWDVMHAARGNLMLKMGQFQGAVQSYSRAIQINPEDPSYLYGRAKAWISQEKYDKAIPDLEKAYRLEPEKLELLPEIGQTFLKAGLPGKAAGYLERFAGYFPEDPEALFLLGQVYFDSGSYLDALRQFNACLQIEKNNPRYYVARGKTYLKARTYRYALNDFGMALDLDPADPETWYLKGQTRWNLNDREGAMTDWERAARLGSFEAAEKLKEHAGGK